MDAAVSRDDPRIHRIVGHPVHQERRIEPRSRCGQVGYRSGRRSRTALQIRRRAAPGEHRTRIRRRVDVAACEQIDEGARARQLRRLNRNAIVPLLNRERNALRVDVLSGPVVVLLQEIDRSELRAYVLDRAKRGSEVC